MQSEAKKDAVCRAKFSVYGSRRDEKEEHTQPQPARAECWPVMLATRMRGKFGPL